MSSSNAVIGTPTNASVTEDTSLQTLIAAGTISISDPNAGQAAFKTSVSSASGNLGTLVLAANGTYTYSVADSAVQYLGAGQTRVDTFTVTSLDGTTKQVSFTIHGTNDAAVIGTPTVHDVTEDAANPLLTATGSISITDADQAQASFQTSVIAAAGDLGHLVLAANGTYTYSVADSAVQYLGAGQTKIDTFTVTSVDGTQKQVSFTIHGANDAAVIGLPTVADVTEDATNPILYAIGTVSISDADQGQAFFLPTIQAGSGNVGALVMGPNGAYIYVVLDAAVQYLGAGDVKVDTFTITAFDGTTKQISFTVHGTNDAAVIGTPSVSNVTEDVNVVNGNLVANGSISISDADQNQSTFQTTVTAAQGDLGHLVVSANGSYTYTVADSAVQYLGAGDTKVDTFTVTSFDGTQKQVSFTIHGANDAAVIGVPTVADVTKNPSLTTLTAAGTISISDADQGQASFKTAVISAAGDLGHLVIAANGSYTYSVAESAVQSLAASATKVDTFTVTSLDGTQKQVSFTIHGGSVNTPASIGNPTMSDVTDDPAATTLTAAGTISITDPDPGQAIFQTTVGSASGNLGSLVLAANGSYTYSVAESAVEYLAAGLTKTETFTVTSADNTTKQVVFTIHGANEAAVIGDPAVHDVTQTAAETTLTASGVLTVSDVDQGQASFQTAVVAADGTLGHLTIAADGTYTYSVDNNAIRYLGDTGTKTENFTVTSLDGTQKLVSFTVHGINDAAVIGTPNVHDVTEDTGVVAGQLTASGTILVTDPDQNQSAFQPETVAAGTNGNLGTLTLTANGTYTYSVADSAVQYLGANDTKVDTFTVTSVDGTSQQVSFNIHGAQDAPTLTVGATATGADDANISLSIAAALVDTSSTLVVSVGNVPSSFTLNHGSISEDGSTWFVNSGDLGSLALVPVGGSATPGTFDLKITASSTDGTHTASTSSDITVTVTPGQGDVHAQVVDGYIAGATVFADHNHNGQLDPGEVFTTTAADGSFTLHSGSDPIVMFGGTDISTNLAFTGVLSAPAGSTVVTPLTTLIAAIVASAPTVDGVPTISIADATSQVAAAFGLDGGTDLTKFDPVSAAVSGDHDTAAIGSAILSAGIQVQSTVAQVSAAGVSSADVFSAIADTVSTAPTTGVDLSDIATVQSIVSGSGLQGTAADIVSQTVQAANTTIQAATDVTALAQASQIAQGDAATAIAQAASTGFTDTTQLQDYTSSTFVSAQAAQATVGVTGAAILGTLGGDVIQGTDGNDAIDGLDGNDTISGGAGNDLLYGNTGNDILIGGPGDDRLDGGPGTDRASYADAAAGVAIDLTAGTAHGIDAGDVANVGNDTLVGIEAAIGSAFADTYNAAGFTGSTGLPGVPAGFNEFEGGGGNDIITGTVNAAGEILTRASYLHASAGVTVDLAAGTGHGTAAGDVANVGTDTLINVNAVTGSQFADVLLGSNNPNGTYEQFDGRGGDDLINGRGGYDLAVYNLDPNTTTGITVHLAAGTVTGDATIGTDTLLSVEAVRGTNFADTYDATGFSGTSTNAGSSGTFNNFDGEGGDDVIIGNGNTRIQYSQSLAAVTVDLAAGTAQGTAAGDIANVGHDTFTGVNAVMGSMFDDTLLGDNSNDTFQGLAGNDYIDGRGGFDVAQYNNLTYTTGSITVNMAAGTVVGDATNGTDTLRSIEGVQGTNGADTYDATGYGAAGALNVGNNGTFNQFEGLGGNDTITGNGNTRVIYGSAFAAVTVDLSLGTAHGTAAGDVAGIGTDTFTGGVFSVTGSAFNDTLIGSANSDMFVGGGGNDQIDGGGGGDIAIFSGTRAQYIVSTDANGVTTVTDTVAGRDGTDTLTNVEALQFTNANVLIASGTAANPVDLSDNRLFFNAQANAFTSATGSADDFVKINQGLSGHLIDLGAGTNDTVILGVTGGYNLNLANVEHVVGTSGDDFIGFQSNVNGLTIDMGGGNDTINLANGANSVAATNIENLNGSDFTGAASNDTLTLLNDVSGLSVNLAQGTNTLNLAAGTNSFINIGSVDTVNGTASDDALTITSGIFSPNGDVSIDLGGGNDTLTVDQQFEMFALHNVEHLVVGSTGAFYTLTNDQNGLSVDLGAGITGLQIASGANTLALTDVSNLNSADFTGGTAPASNDVLTLSNDVSGISVNLGQGTNTLDLAAGSNSFTGLFNVDTVNGTASDDTLTVSNGINSQNNDVVIDLGAGNDTVVAGGGFNAFGLVNVEHLLGDAGDNSITLLNDVSGLSVDLGAGNDNLGLAAGVNSLSVTNVESITTTDFFNGTPSSDDVLTLLDDVSGVTVNLQQGTNTLNLAAGTNALTDFNIQQINGTSSDDHLALQNQTFGTTIDLGAGNDTLQLADGGNFIIADNIENVTGGSGNDNIVVNSAAGTTTTVTGGLGQDTIGTAVDAGATDIRFTSTADSSVGNGDTVNSFDAGKDAFVFDHVAGLATQIHFVSSGILDGTQSEAILNGNLLQIDVNGDGMIGAGDMQVFLNGLSGTLTDANFVATGVTTVDHAPTAINLAGSTVAENSPAGTFVGLLTSADPDAGDTATYTLIDSAGGAFAINGSTLVVNGPIDYETTPTEQVTVRVTDSGGLSFDQNFTIGVTNVNEAPTNISLAGSTVAENSANGTVVGVLTSVDPDAGDTATYSLTDNAGGAFAISGNELVVAGPINFEATPTEQVTVKVTDSGGLSFDKTFTIGVTDVNEAPTAVTLLNQVASTSENGGNVKVADIAITDDALGSDVLSLSGADAASFSIVSGVNGPELHFLGGANFEAKASYDVTVLVNDVTASNHVSPDASQAFHLAITNVDEAPTDISLSGAAIGQSSAAGTVVGSLSAVDPDAGDTAAFSLLDNDGGQFALSGNNVVVAGPLSAGPQQIVVRDTDSGGLTFDKTLTINVSTGVTITGTAGNDVLAGTAGDDVIQGLGGNDRLQGLAGNDVLDGGTGFDRAVYTDATAGISFNLASGTVDGSAAGTGIDTLVNVEGIVGTSFADTYDPTGFVGDSSTPGTPVGFNEFDGGGGNDTIMSETNSQGALLTRISYIDATAGVTVNLQTHTATGDASVGTDTLVGNGFSGIIGSNFADTLTGSNNASGTVETFEGRGGNDLINGGGGFDRADYNNDPATTSGITVNMAAGTVVGDATVGTDTLRSVEAVRGTNFADTYVATGFSGTSTNAGSNGTFNEFTGAGGNDTITGNGNTRLSYNNATAGVTVNLTTGNAHGTAAGDVANVGTDTFTGVNAVMGSMFDDVITGSGNTAATETFTGLAGNDFIDGQGGFDISSYNNIYFTTGAVTVNMGAGTATGDASIGSDTLRSIEGIQGTNFADTYDASTFGAAGALNVGSNGTFNQFEGLGGNDTITGNGNTRVIYSSAGAGVTINLAAGTATGDASVGTDSFTAVNSATGSAFNDTYNAAGFVGGVGAFASGNFNLFEGLAGNDTITGNGNTRVAYSQAAAAVTVDLSLGTAHGTAVGDVANVGTDTITGGVNSVQGSNFNDTLIGSGGNELFFGGSGNDSISAGGGNDQITGGVGNDTIDGGAGTDVAIYTGPASAYTITSPGAGQTQVADSVTTRDGTDILTNVELLQFTDSTVMLTSGSAAAPVDISSIGFGAANTPLTGTSADDYLMVGGNVFGHQVNLGAGNDTVALAPGGQFFQLNLVNVENVVGSAGDDNITLVNAANGLTVDLGTGNNSINLANGVNSLNVTNVQNISSTDFSGAASNDTLTLLDNVTGVTVNLQQGNNTLNLAAGTNTFADIFNIQQINGTASDDNLIVTDAIFESGQNPIIDLGAGNNALTFGSQFAQFTALNIQHIVGTASDGGLTLNNDVFGVDVTLGGGNDNLTLAAGADSVSIHNIANVDFNDFAAGTSSDDTLTLLNDVSGVSANGANGENTLNLAAGSNSFTDVFNFQHINGTASDDALTVTQQIGAPDTVHIDLGGGDNTLNLDVAGATLDIANVQHLNGDAQDNFVNLLSDVSGLSVDLGAGNDTLVLANGTNSISVTNVENVNGSDFTGGLNPSDDTLNLLNDVTGVSFNLGDGDNTINLAAGTNSVDNLFNINQVNGTASDDVLTVTQQSFGTVFDMGAGNDTIIFGSMANGVTVNNAETVIGSAGNDFIAVNSVSGITSVAGGLGADTITIGSGAAAIHYGSAAESSVGNGDTVVNFDAASDTFTFSGMTGGSNGFAGPIQFQGSAAFDGSAAVPHSEARIDTTGGQTTLQIDVNGDGQFGANDIEIHLANLAGTLHDANFVLV